MSDEIESDDDEDDDRVDDDNDIEALVNKLPLEMRRKILSKEKVSESEEESEADGSDEDEANRWGKKKNYWNADTADIEDAEDLDDAKEEEAATKELLQAKLKRMQKQDFYDDLEGSEEDGDDSLDEDSQEANTLGAKLQSKNKASSKGKAKQSQKKVRWECGGERGRVVVWAAGVVCAHVFLLCCLCVVSVGVGGLMGPLFVLGRPSQCRSASHVPVHTWMRLVTTTRRREPRPCKHCHIQSARRPCLWPQKAVAAGGRGPRIQPTYDALAHGIQTLENSRHES